MSVELNPTLGSTIELIKDSDRDGVISPGDEVRIITEDEKIIDGHVQYINMRHPEVTTIILLGRDNKQYSFTMRNIRESQYEKSQRNLYDITNLLELNLLWCYARDKKKDNKTFKNILERVISLAKDIGVDNLNKNKKIVVGHAYFNLGDLKFRDNDYDGALENYQQALSHYGEDFKSIHKAELIKLIKKCSSIK